MDDAQLPLFSEVEQGAQPKHVSAKDDLTTPEWLLGLMNVEGIGNKKALKLVQHFETYHRLSTATESEIQAVIGKNSIDFEKLEKVEVEFPDNVKIATYFDSEYPAGLRDLPDAPPILWYWGRTTTRLLAKMCGDLGLTVISGLATGIDTEAHLGCLESISPTVAILACDVRNPSPKSNSRLASDILEKGGCLIAEVPLGSVTESYSLVARNRLQAAWSQGLLVTQCGIPSGTLHTVRFALELGRKLIVLTPPAGAVGSQYDGNRNLVDEFSFDSRILGGSKKLQELLQMRKRGADLTIDSISQFENYLQNV